MNFLVSKGCLNVKGKNINRFIKKLTTNKIDILKIKYINKNEANITIYKKDYDQIFKIKSIYEIKELDIFGPSKIKKQFFKNRHLMLLICLSFVCFLLLSNIIFDVEIIHSNKDLRELLRDELSKEGIKKYSFKKSYEDVAKIKKQILNKYPDKIEWLEIENFGTKYLVRAEERKIPAKKNNNDPRNIIAKKSGIIKKVIALSGDIVKDMDDYVEKGDLIINGELIFNNKVTGKVRADGSVYAEIWYITKTEYPFVINKKKTTGRKKKVYVLKFLNHSFELSINKFKYKKIKEKEIYKNQLIPFSLCVQDQEELDFVSEVLTFEEALSKAKEASIKQVNSKLNAQEYIIRNNYLKSTIKNSTIEVEMFFAVYEDITDYQEIG